MGIDCAAPVRINGTAASTAGPRPAPTGTGIIHRLPYPLQLTLLLIGAGNASLGYSGGLYTGAPGRAERETEVSDR